MTDTAPLRTEVAHYKKHPHTSRDVYIGRPTKWGNPFVVGKDGTRAEVIAKYEDMLRNTDYGAELMVMAKTQLKGKRLMCWCSPAACHGDVLARIAEEP